LKKHAGPGGEDSSASNRRTFQTFALSVFSAVLIASVLSHGIASWVSLSRGTPTYRRIGPETGGQLFAAGSSLLQFGLDWPQLWPVLGQGIECWGVGGSTPSEWEVFQSLPTKPEGAIIGVSIYDLNEYHLCEARADLVPLLRTISDLWNSGSSWEFSKRLLSQYPLAYLRQAFPTAARSDAVLVGLRKKLRELRPARGSADDRALGGVVLPGSVLQFGEDREKVSDWPAGKKLRRGALMYSHIQGRHAFEGPKRLAFDRMMKRAVQSGRTIIAVMPVSPAYFETFPDPASKAAFEDFLREVERDYKGITLIRLDQLPTLASNEYYSDLVHLNSAGRRLATEAFLAGLNSKSISE